MAQLLGRMERNGLIRRDPHPHDRRSKRIKLTARAEERLPAAVRTLKRGNEEVLAGFTNAEVETLVSLLQRIVANLDQVPGARPLL